MQTILISPLQPPHPVFATKHLQSNTVDLPSLIETELFLNHHYNLSLYFIRNNFPYQFQTPIKICKMLLERNGEGFVEIYVNNGVYFKIEGDRERERGERGDRDRDRDGEFMEIMSCLQGVWNQLDGNVVFLVRFWEIQIRLVFVNQVLQENKFKQSIAAIQLSSSYTPTPTPPHTPSPTPQISKLILYIDDSNLEQFSSWSQSPYPYPSGSSSSPYSSPYPHHPFQYASTSQQNEKLSHEYMSLKQEIDNEKNVFRNKIKMVQAILGENINIDKLLLEEKEENQEYKRLRETFQTIKNIDNVLIEQEKRLEQRKMEMKEKRMQKQRVYYENAKIWVKKRGEIMELGKEIQRIKYKIECVMANKGEYQAKRNFQPSVKIKGILQEQANRCKQILKNVSNFYSVTQNYKKKSFIKSVGQQHEKTSNVNTTNGNINANNSILANINITGNQINSLNNQRIKPRIIQSLHKSQKRQLEQYQNLLRIKVNQNKLQKKSLLSNTIANPIVISNDQGLNLNQPPSPSSSLPLPLPLPQNLNLQTVYTNISPKLMEQQQKYQNILKNMAKFYIKNNNLLGQIQQKISSPNNASTFNKKPSNSHHTTFSSPSSPQSPSSPFCPSPPLTHIPSPFSKNHNRNSSNCSFFQSAHQSQYPPQFRITKSIQKQNQNKNSNSTSLYPCPYPLASTSPSSSFTCLDLFPIPQFIVLNEIFAMMDGEEKCQYYLISGKANPDRDGKDDKQGKVRIESNASIKSISQKFGYGQDGKDNKQRERQFDRMYSNKSLITGQILNKSISKIKQNNNKLIANTNITNISTKFQRQKQKKNTNITTISNTNTNGSINGNTNGNINININGNGNGNGNTGATTSKLLKTKLKPSFQVQGKTGLNI